MNMNYEIRPNRKWKLLYMLLGMVILAAMMYFGGTALAGPRVCPPGQRDNCWKWENERTGEVACFPDKANLGGPWRFLNKRCGDNEPDPVDAPTAIVVPTLAPTSPPVSTQVPVGAIVPTLTATAQEFRLVETGDVVCDYCEQLKRIADAQETMAAYETRP